MFSKKEKTLGGKVTGFIGQGISLKGRLSFEGTVRIDGEFEGEIEAKGVLLIGEGAVVKANVIADIVTVMGEIRGNVEARKRVDIPSPGKVWGDITTPVLVISEGGFFEGNCSMGGEKEKAPVNLSSYREIKASEPKLGGK